MKGKTGLGALQYFVIVCWGCGYEIASLADYIRELREYQ